MLRKCLFPVAGYGTRFLPATKSMPKEMLPIVNKPLIQYGVEEAMAAGLTDLGFVTGRNKRAIPDHFDISYELENEIAGSSKETHLASVRKIMNQCTFTYTRQTRMLGLGHAILTGEPIINTEPFGVLLADDLCLQDDGGAGVLEQMYALYQQFHCTVLAVEEVPDAEIHKYGVISGHSLGNGVIRVTDMVEKPAPGTAPSNLAVVGRYILTPDIFDILRRTPPGAGGEIQITDALRTQARESCVIALRFRGKRFDCGSIPGYVAATSWAYENIYCAENPTAMPLRRAA